MRDPFTDACLQARLQVPLEPLAESVPMPETPQIGDEIRSTFGEFKGVENKENPSSDVPAYKWVWGLNVFGDQDDFLQWLQGK